MKIEDDDVFLHRLPVTTITSQKTGMLNYRLKK